MKKFKHYDAYTIDEAVALLDKYEGKAKVIAGGTDIIGTFKDSILPEMPEALINIKTIKNFDYIKDEGNMLKIGPLALLDEIFHNEIIKKEYTALADAARRTASPHIREMGTIGGNLCQDSRCWYYRCPNNRFNCIRKGGEDCFADEGENRYHSIFGDVKDCLAVHPSDLAPALTVLGAKVKTTKRLIDISDFYQDEDPQKLSILDNNEIVTEIQIPRLPKNTKSSFVKQAIRKSIDFPIVNCASMVVCEEGKVKNAKICLNAVYMKPYIPVEAEDFMKGKTIEAEAVEAAADLAVSKAKALERNEYKIQIAKGLIKKTLLNCK